MGAGKGALGKAYPKVADLYHNEDVAVRLAHFIHLRKQGVGAKEAAEQAKKWIPTYQNLSNFSRGWGKVVPFFAYTAEALPLVAEATVKNPARMLSVGAVAYALEKTLFDGEVDEGVLPQEMRGLLSRVPAPDFVKEAARRVYPSFIPLHEQQDGTRSYLDFTYVMPYGDLGENRGAGYGPLDFLPGQANPFSNPLIGTVGTLALNKDRLTGREITTRSMGLGEKAQATADFLYKQALPGLAPEIPGVTSGGWGYMKMRDAATGTPNWYGDVRGPGSALLDVVGGMKQRQVVPEREYNKRANELRREIEDAQDRLRQTLRHPATSPQAKQAARDDYQRKALRLQQELQALRAIRPGAAGR
jgi:hypothetical protein